MLLLPPERLDERSTLTIFLAGPVQGADDWQQQAISLIHKKVPELIIASPRRKTDVKYQKGDFPVKMYNEQVDWETVNLRLAGTDGVVMFWLAKEYQHRCDRAYSQTSRFELGEWKVWHQVTGIDLVVGIEEGFTNRRYIRRRFSQDCPKVPIFSTLEETCYKTIEIAREKLK